MFASEFGSLGNPYFARGPACISFSGGRTSGYLLWQVLDAHGGTLPDDVHVVFANTGRERDETLDFVFACSVRFGVPITWVEYDGREGRLDFREVDAQTCSRDGEPFERLTDHKNALPNLTGRWCTQTLKVDRIRAFMRSRGYTEWTDFVGLRADEPGRVTKRRAAADDEVSYALPLYDAGVTEPMVRAFWRAQPFDLQLESNEGNCDLCLAGETEVVTSEGIRPIRELAGTTPELLVPKVSNGGLSEVGSFVRAPVRSFGVQRLWRVELAGRGRSQKTVYATADHRWFTVERGETKTAALRPGDKLKNLNRCPVGEDRGGASRVAAMQGFVFGDGAVAQGARPGTLDIHDGPKLRAMGPLFAAICGDGTETVNAHGTTLRHFYGVPRAWKRDLPDLSESRHFLMGWLSGWFAADGCVTEDGACILSSATREHLEFARSLCAILGVSCSQVRGGARVALLPGGREMEAELYALSINRFHLTADFFWLEHHRARVEANREKQQRRYGWSVVSVAPTERVEEVFCATVEGVGAFGLADGLMTGNCFMKGPGVLRALIAARPELADWWIKREHRTHRRFSSLFTYAELRDAALIPVEQLTGRARALALADAGEIACACTD